MNVLAGDMSFVGTRPEATKYVNDILPEKMKYNLESIRKFSFWRDVRTMFGTVATVLGKKY